MSGTRENGENGFVFVFFSFALVLILMVAAFSVDLSRVRDEHRRIQYATDSAAIAGAYYVGYTPDGDVITQAQAAGSANSLSVQQNEMFSIQCGRWIRGTECTQDICREFIPCAEGGPCLDCADSDANAVRVQSRRTVQNTFARLMGQDSITPQVSSVALALPNPDLRCVKPLGVVFTYLDGLIAGDEFTIYNNAPGNWGKIDVGGENYSSGNNFGDAILGPGACAEDVYVGAPVDSSTGNGGSIHNVMDDAIRLEKNSDWTLPVITQQSNGQNSVTMLEFIKVNLIRSLGGGQNWSGTFRIIERGVTLQPPPPGPGLQERFLVQ